MKLAIAVVVSLMAGALTAAVVLSRMARRRKPPRGSAGRPRLAEPPLTGGDPDVAERYYRQKLARSEEDLGREHPDVARDLDALARFYRTQNRSAELENVLRRALAIREKALGPDHPQVLADLGGLANIHLGRGEYAEARAIYRKILAVHEQNQGKASHGPLEQVGCLGRLAECAEHLGETAEAEHYYRRALAVREETSGPEHPSVVGPLAQLAEFYRSIRRYDEAETLYRRIMPIVEASGDHKDLGAGYRYASLLREMGRQAEADALERRTRAAQEAAFGAERTRANALGSAMIEGST